MENDNKTNSIFGLGLKECETEQNNVIQYEALAKAVKNKDTMKQSAEVLKRMFDGEPVNENPLKEIPKPQMKLYGFWGVFSSKFFDTKKELNKYIKTIDTNYGNICTIEYLGNVAGRSDVIRVTGKNKKALLYSVCDRDEYGIYNEERSIYRGEFIWEYNHGRLVEMYSAFRDRGIVFEDDIYAKEAEQYRKILQYFKERNSFNKREIHK